MKEKCKHVELFCMAALLLPGILSGQAYIPLKANFVYSPEFQIFNDKEAPSGEYAYIDAGKGSKGNPYIGFEMSKGQFMMAVTKSAEKRYVPILLNRTIDFPPTYPPNSPCYPNVPPDMATIRYNLLRTMSEFLDIDGDGLLEQTGQALNVMNMRTGDVKYCFMTCRFEVLSDSNFFELGGGEPSAVVRVSVEEDLLGRPVWVLKPLKDYIVDGQPLDFVNRKLWHVIRRASCDQGTYAIDFELRVTAK